MGKSRLVVSKTRFYLFRLRFGKIIGPLSFSEFVWSRIVDEKMALNFTLNDEGNVEKRSKVVPGIRQNGKTDTLKFGGLIPHNATPSSSHFLGDSSLSQDVATFDFHESLPNPANSQSTQNGNSLTTRHYSASRSFPDRFRSD